MSNISAESSNSVVRWVARILGSLIGIVGLFGTIETLLWNLGNPSEVKTSGLLVWLGFFLVFLGGAFGWFKELIASLFILAATALLALVALLAPSAFKNAWTLSIPGLVGIIFLYIHFAGKKYKNQ